MSDGISPLSIGAAFASAILVISLGLAVVRLIRGPHATDRIMALDLITAIVIGLLSLLCIQSGESVYLRAALVLALIAFLGTVAYSHYIEQRVAK